VKSVKSVKSAKSVRISVKSAINGFSLTEILIAVGILAVGMTFIAGVFPAGIYLTTIATERTIAAVAADEAFAKIRIYAACDPIQPIDLSKLSVSELRPDDTVDFSDILPAMDDPNEFLYPSPRTAINVPEDSNKQYCWSALFRQTGVAPNLVQVTVFVCRKVSQNLKYRTPNGSNDSAWPMPVKVGVSGSNNELQIGSGKETYINDGYTIVDDVTGRIYRVLERYKVPNDNKVLLDRNWEGAAPNAVWVVPPPTGGGRYPCIAVYQKVIRF
jgi:prepilin-type N-terminal cleavage/methylation domain-containing protein